MPAGEAENFEETSFQRWTFQEDQSGYFKQENR